MLADKKRKRYSAPTGGQRITDGSQADQVDINNIVKTYIRTGLAPQRAAGRFEDVSSLDYMAMRNFIADKEALFGGLPARVRARFGGDPYQLLRFVENPNNRDEAIKLGLVESLPPGGVRAAQVSFLDPQDPGEGGETPDGQEALREDEESQPRKGAKSAKNAAPKGGKSS